MENGISEMYRILKPGGKVMCLEFSRPANPVFRQLYDVYSRHVMPAVGQLLVGLGQAYAHLPESIRMFAMPEEMALLFEKAGFTCVHYRKLTNGIATVHLARRNACS
jgi:demethylmenaquinone methyltransferase/2-methoxy-6-polyprenyl-1,4-benzoquinol methylase